LQLAIVQYAIEVRSGGVGFENTKSCKATKPQEIADRRLIVSLKLFLFPLYLVSPDCDGMMAQIWRKGFIKSVDHHN
jgi:hypothetical protein